MSKHGSFTFSGEDAELFASTVPGTVLGMRVEVTLDSIINDEFGRRAEFSLNRVLRDGDGSDEDQDAVTRAFILNMDSTGLHS